MTDDEKHELTLAMMEEMDDAEEGEEDMAVDAVIVWEETPHGWAGSFVDADGDDAVIRQVPGEEQLWIGVDDGSHQLGINVYTALQLIPVLIQFVLTGKLLPVAPDVPAPDKKDPQP
jgi:hypothetical protein